METVELSLERAKSKLTKNELAKIESRLEKATAIKKLYMERKSQNDICLEYPNMSQEQCSFVTQFWGFKRTRAVNKPQDVSVLLESCYDFLDVI